MGAARCQARASNAFNGHQYQYSSTPGSEINTTSIIEHQHQHCHSLNACQRREARGKHAQQHILPSFKVGQRQLYGASEGANSGVALRLRQQISTSTKQRQQHAMTYQVHTAHSAQSSPCLKNRACAAVQTQVRAVVSPDGRLGRGNSRLVLYCM